MRDRPELEVFECASCGLVFLSPFDHIRDGFYESSEMHGEEMPDVQAWIKEETTWDDERRSLSRTEVYGYWQLKQQKHQRPPLFKRKHEISNARAIISYLAAVELRYSGAKIAAALRLSEKSVSRCIERGEKLLLCR